MKKKYVKPFGKLIALNISENIAASEGGEQKHTGQAFLEYTHGPYPCHTYISGNTDMVSKNNKWVDMALYYLIADKKCIDGILSMRL